MGRLVYFNRKINIASDDLYIFATYLAALHLIWLISTAFAYFSVRTDCSVNELAKWYIFLVGICLTIQLPNDIIVLTLSMMGTVAEEGPRRFIGPFIHFGTFTMFFELVLDCVGFYVVFGPYPLWLQSPTCTILRNHSSITLIRMVVAWGFSALTFWFIILTILVVNSTGRKMGRVEKYINIWQQRLEFYCFRTGDKRLAESKEAMKDVAREIANYFHEIDWAPSDILVALILLKREQKRIIEVRQARRLIVDQPKGFSIPIVDSTDALGELQAAMKTETRYIIGETDLLNNNQSKVPVTIEEMEEIDVSKSIISIHSTTKPLPESSFSNLELPSPSFKVDESTSSKNPSPLTSSEKIVVPTTDESIPKTYLPSGPAPSVVEDSAPIETGSKNLISSSTGLSAVEDIQIPTDIHESDEFNNSNNAKPIISVDKNLEHHTVDIEKSNIHHQTSNEVCISCTPNALPSKPSISFNFIGRHRAKKKDENHETSNRTLDKSSHKRIFKPWSSRKKKRAHHRNINQKMERGTMTRESIDDILHYARYAELVYLPKDVDVIFNKEKLLHHASKNDVFKSPYIIVHDSDYDTVVLAIRGTDSTVDILTDLSFDEAIFDLPELREYGSTHYAHRGMLRTAENIVEEIKTLNVLSPLIKDIDSPLYDCELVVTGHSLGAGVAALVSCLLRSEFPSVSCYCYEPPGGLVSAGAAEYLEAFCTSVVMGDDFIPRCSRTSLEIFKHDISRTIQSCDQPKYQILGSVFGLKLFCGGYADSDRKGILHAQTPEGKLSPEAVDLIKRRSVSLRAGHSIVPKPSLNYPQLFIPGKILYIEKLRRPPLKLNQAIGNAFSKVKESTKAAGEKILDGVEEFGERIKDGAEGIKERFKEGAGGIRRYAVKRHTSIDGISDSDLSSKRDAEKLNSKSDDNTDSEFDTIVKTEKARHRRKETRQEHNLQIADEARIENSSSAIDKTSESGCERIGYIIPLKSDDNLEQIHNFLDSANIHDDKSKLSHVECPSMSNISVKIDIPDNKFVKPRPSVAFDESRNTSKAPKRISLPPSVYTGEYSILDVNSKNHRSSISSQKNINRKPSSCLASSSPSLNDIELSKPLYPPSYALKKGGVPRIGTRIVPTPRLNGKYHYIPRWAKKEEFQEVILSRSMRTDHSPFELLREFQTVPHGSVLGFVTRD